MPLTNWKYQRATCTELQALPLTDSNDLPVLELDVIFHLCHIDIRKYRFLGPRFSQIINPLLWFPCIQTYEVKYVLIPVHCISSLRAGPKRISQFRDGSIKIFGLLLDHFWAHFRQKVNGGSVVELPIVGFYFVVEVFFVTTVFIAF